MPGIDDVVPELPWNQVVMLIAYFTAVLIGTIIAFIFRDEIRRWLKKRWRAIVGDKKTKTKKAKLKRIKRDAKYRVRRF